MKISYDNSHTETHRKNSNISWQDFNARVSTTVRTTQIVEEYRKMTKDQQVSIKDKGSFVAGHLNKGRRKKGHLLYRSMMALDMDISTPNVWDTGLMKQSYVLMYSCNLVKTFFQFNIKRFNFICYKRKIYY